MRRRLTLWLITEHKAHMRPARLDQNPELTVSLGTR